jgi:hypothetical protein
MYDLWGREVNVTERSNRWRGETAADFFVDGRGSPAFLSRDGCHVSFLRGTGEMYVALDALFVVLREVSGKKLMFDDENAMSSCQFIRKHDTF